METQEKIKKLNVGYFLVNTLGPVVVVIATLVYAINTSNRFGVYLSMAAFGFAVCWWAFLGRKVYEKARDTKLSELAAQGFHGNQVFHGDGCTVAVDLTQGMLALIFRWNPKQSYVIPASRIARVWVDDGRGGVGFLEGSSRVSFLFTVDGITIRVNTFTSNRRWRMDSDYILTGISKADLMVEALVGAGAGAN